MKQGPRASQPQLANALPYGSRTARKEGKMKFGLRQVVIQATGTTLACLLGVVLANGQAGGPVASQGVPAQKEEMAEAVFKNIQVLKGISVKEFMDTMGFFAASTGLNCADCHVSEEDWAAYAKDNDLKQTARKMVLMMNAINRGNFAGK